MRDPRCPHCQGSLQPRALPHGESVATCAPCGGAFFPRGALARALGAETDLRADPPAHALDEGPCPDCGAVLMKRVPFAPLLPLTVLRCPYCEGVFAQLRDLPAMRASSSARRPAAPAAPVAIAVDPDRPGFTPLSLRQTLLAMPVAFALAALLRGSTLAKIVLGGVRIPLHELGHASVAWLSGYSALPVPFGVTWISRERSVLTGLVIAAGIAAAATRLARAGAWAWAALVGALLLPQAALSLVARDATRQMLITFAGSGAELVFAALLVALFHARLPDRARWEHARWIALAVGAFVLVDKTLDWRAARFDDDLIPWASVMGDDGDMQRLTRDHGWSTGALARRYAALAHACCALTLAAWTASAARAWRDRGA